jgi:hypothetical protein
MKLNENYAVCDLSDQISERGYKKGLLCRDLYGNEFTISSDYLDLELLKYPEPVNTIALRDGDGNIILANGFWSEPI